MAHPKSLYMSNLYSHLTYICIHKSTYIHAYSCNFMTYSDAHACAQRTVCTLSTTTGSRSRPSDWATAHLGCCRPLSLRASAPRRALRPCRPPRRSVGALRLAAPVRVHAGAEQQLRHAHAPDLHGLHARRGACTRLDWCAFVRRPVSRGVRHPTTQHHAAAVVAAHSTSADNR